MPEGSGRAFKSGNSIAVRLSKDVAYPAGTDLIVERKGDVVTMRPRRPSIQAMIAALDALPSPPYIEVRDDEEIPERPGM